MNDLIEGCKLSVIFEGIDIYAEDIDPVEVRRKIEWFSTTKSFS